jgi:hypothetical protein
MPSLNVQREIADNIEAERKVVDSCRELVIRYEEKTSVCDEE